MATSKLASFLPERQKQVVPGERQRQALQQGGVHLAVFDFALERQAEPGGDFFHVRRSAVMASVATPCRD